MKSKNLNIKIIKYSYWNHSREETKSNFIWVKERMKSRWLTGVRLTAPRDVEKMCRWLKDSFLTCMMAVSEHMDE